jgi:hypothetical protein
MALLLTILSVLAAWTFLGVLIVALLLIFKTLESVRGSLQKIAMGVRAIEQETSRIGELSTTGAALLNEARDGFSAAADSLAAASGRIAAAAPAFRRK